VAASDQGGKRTWSFKLDDATVLEVSVPAGPTEKQVRKRGRWPLLLGVLVASMMLSTMAVASVYSDYPDYAPGSVVTISGDNSNEAGYLPGEIVDVVVLGPNGYQATCEATVSPVPSDNCAWSCQVTLWDSLDAVGTYTYTATGRESGVSESGTFTDNVNISIDSSPFVWKVTGAVSGGTGFDVAVSGKYTCTSGSSGSNIACSAPTGITVAVLPDAGGAAVGSKIVSVSSTGPNQNWSTTLEFRSSPTGTPCWRR